MNVSGVITEYNPFHNGHKYQLDRIRQLTGADHILCVMSGNFVQRGSAALLDKYTRTRMALQEGADLVIELPLVYATASAELFAQGGVLLLDQCGIVSSICFGAECPDPTALNRLAAVITEETPFYKEALASGLQKGLSFPRAREEACLAASGLPAEDVHKLLCGSNNILALEYLKALQRSRSDLQPILIPRVGAAYQDTRLSADGFSSASAIRDFLENPPASGDFALLQEALPAASYSLLLEAVEKGNPVFDSSMDQILGFRLLQYLSEEERAAIADLPSDLLHRMEKQLERYHGFESFCDLIKTKAYTRASIKRALLHLLLDIRQSELDFARSHPVPYIRVLGFRRNSQNLVSDLKTHASVPLILNPASDSRTLCKEALSFLQKDFFATRLYDQLRRQNGGEGLKNDLAQPLVIIE